MSYDNEILSRAEPPQWFVTSSIEDWNSETCQICGEHFMPAEAIGEVAEFRGHPQFIHERCYRAAIESQEESA